MINRDYGNEVVMKWARHLPPDGGAPQPLHLSQYEEGEHKGRLCCYHCDARVHYHSGSPSKDADNSFQAPHFHTYPKQQHSEECDYGRLLQRQPARSGGTYDETAGYRFNLDMDFISGVRHYQHIKKRFNELGRIWPEELYDREPVPVMNAADFLGHFRRLDIERIQKSLVLWHNRITPWADFFIRGSERFPHLIDRLRADPDFDGPVMLYIHPQRRLRDDRDRQGRDRMNFACRSIRHPELGEVEVRLCLYDRYARNNVSPGQPVLAICKPNLFMGEKTILYVDIRDERNLTSGNILDVLSKRPDRFSLPSSPPAP